MTYHVQFMGEGKKNYYLPKRIKYLYEYLKKEIKNN